VQLEDCAALFVSIFVAVRAAILTKIRRFSAVTKTIGG
jgi:hypothetical protein